MCSNLSICVFPMAISRKRCWRTPVYPSWKLSLAPVQPVYVCFIQNLPLSLFRACMLAQDSQYFERKVGLYSTSTSHGYLQRLRTKHVNSHQACKRAVHAVFPLHNRIPERFLSLQIQHHDGSFPRSCLGPQPMSDQEFLHDLVSTRGVVVQVDSMSSVWLNVGFESLGCRESPGYSAWDRSS